MNFLVQHAINNVWAEPLQDRQEWIEVTRLTDVYGGVAGFTIYSRHIRFPEVPGTRFFHFYHLGSFPQALVGLSSIGREWVSLSALVVSQNILIQAILASGVAIPLNRCWIKRAMDKGIYLAIELKRTDSFGVVERYDAVTNRRNLVERRIGDEQLYLRFYSNALVRQDSWRANRPNINRPYTVISKRVEGVGDLLAFKSSVQEALVAYAGQGGGYYTKGGYIVNTPGAFEEAHAGYVWTYTHDITMDLMVERPLSQLATFVSDADPLTAKYLIWESSDYDRIDYHDDIDFVLFSNSAKKGVLVPRYKKTTVRQVTHNGYSTPVSVVEQLIQANLFARTGDDLVMRMYIRRGGMSRPLVSQADRLPELFSLPWAIAQSYLTGSEANIPFWQARHLENGDYAKIVSGKLEDITPSLVEAAYGYHAVNKVAYLPYQDLSSQSGIKQIKLFPGNATDEPQVVYSYDTQGFLSGINAVQLNGVQVNNLSFAAPLQSSGAIELLVGQIVDIAHDRAPCYYGDTFVVSGLRHNHLRVYLKRTTDSGVIDVTGQSLYTISKDVFAWNSDVLASAEFKMVRLAGFIAHYEQNFVEEDYRGVVDFTFPEFPIDAVKSASVVGYGNFDVFLNGSLLIEEIDYYVVWPRVVIVKRPTSSVSQMQILARAYGFPDSDTLVHAGPREVGFVSGGVLSVNNIYDLRSDRNLRLVVDGKLTNSNGLAVAEKSGGVLIADGRPYAISDYRQDIDSFSMADTCASRHASDERDLVVSEVLKHHLPMRKPAMGFVDGARWKLVSPVVSRLLHAFVKDRYLSQGQGEISFDNIDVERWIAPFEDLFGYDPCARGVNPYFLNTLPHQYDTPMTISIGQYQILAYVIKHYLRDQVDISSLVNIGV